jgi:hypothetical protein
MCVIENQFVVGEEVFYVSCGFGGGYFCFLYGDYGWGCVVVV